MKKGLLKEAHRFLDQVFQKLDEINLDLSKNELDHICYRVERESDFQNLKEEFLLDSELLSDKEINGREICVFKLKEPIIYNKREIYLLELPAPKKGSYYQNGFEHVEFVIKKELRIFISERPDLNFNVKGINKVNNPETRLNFSFGAIKFHPYNLEYVIKFLD